MVMSDRQDPHVLTNSFPTLRFSELYAMTSLQERCTMFLEPTTEVYEGMIVGENSRADDMDVNITKEKQQTNIRSATSDKFEKLIPPKKLSLEQCLEFCRDDEDRKSTRLNSSH